MNATRDKVEAKYVKAMAKMSEKVLEGKAAVGGEACVEVCHGTYSGQHGICKCTSSERENTICPCF